MRNSHSYSHQYTPLPGFNSNVYQEGGGGLGSIFSAVSRILLPASTLLLPGFAGRAVQLLGNVIIDRVESSAKHQIGKLAHRARTYNSRLQSGGGTKSAKLKKQASRSGRTKVKVLKSTKKVAKTRSTKKPTKAKPSKAGVPIKRKQKTKKFIFSDPNNIFG